MLLSLLVAFGATVVAAHPVYHHKFKAIVNSDPCLKKCMDNATEDDRELNLLKTANVTGFLLNLDEHCSVISSARGCIAACKIDSAHNPFTLESMNSVCSEETVVDVRQLRPCLRKVDSEAENGVNTCREKCGDYDEVNDHVHSLSKAYTPETHDQHKEREVMGRLNDACKILKCSDRCTVDVFSDKCPNLADGRDAGDSLATIIERVLVAQRKDLERLRLVDTMAHSLPIECSFMYVPEVMLNETKDAEAMHEINQSLSAVHAADRAIHRHQRMKHEHLNLALSQLHTRQLQKQIEVLDLQAENLKKESEKLDMEIELLEKKTGEEEAKTNKEKVTTEAP